MFASSGTNRLSVVILMNVCIIIKQFSNVFFQTGRLLQFVLLLPPWFLSLVDLFLGKFLTDFEEYKLPTGYSYCVFSKCLNKIA